MELGRLLFFYGNKINKAIELLKERSFDNMVEFLKPVNNEEEYQEEDSINLPQVSISTNESDPIHLSSKVDSFITLKSGNETIESSEIHAMQNIGVKRNAHSLLPCQQEVLISQPISKEQEEISSQQQLQDKSKISRNTHKKRDSIYVGEHKSLNDRIFEFLFIIKPILSIVKHQWQSCLGKCKDHQRHTHICSRKCKNEQTSTCHSFCHDCGHNSSKSHLCKCKCCRDVIGELFNCLQKYLVFMHFTRRDFALLCGYVTCNAGQLLCVNHVPKPELSLVRDLIVGNNKNNDNCKDCQRKNPKISPIPLIVGQVKHTVNKNFLYFCFLSLIIKLCFISSILLVKVSYTQRLKNRNERRQKYTIYVSSLVLVLCSLNKGYLPERQYTKIKNKEKSSLLEKFEHDSRYRVYGKRQSTVIFSKDKLMDLISALHMNHKPKNIKGFLYSIINHVGLARNIDILSYPVIRNDMTNELYRIASLYNFPYDNSPSLIRLAESGFYYEGKGREVICFSCSIKFDGWSHNSIPLEIHRQLSPNCAYLKEKFATSKSAITDNQLEYSDGHMNAATAILNTEIIEADSRRQCTDTASAAPVISSYSAPDSSKGYNDSGVFGSSQPSQSNNSTDAANQFQYRHMVTSASKDSGYASSGGNFQSNSSSSRYGSNITRPQLPVVSDRPISNQHNVVIPASRDSATPQNNKNTPKEKYPEYIPIERRRATYKNWPPNLDFLHPLDLSECGFFYSNFGDCVRCFHCGIGLRNWESDDNPWVEHARWSRKCPYLLQRKGQEFIDSVLTVLGIQTDSEIEQQAASVASETTMQATSGFVSGPDVRDPIEHHAAQYIIKEQMFGDRLVKKTMNQLLQNHDWENITNEMLVNALLESNDNIETKTDPADLSELTKSNDTSTSKSEQKNTKEAEDNQGSNEEDPGKIQKENEDLKDLYTCKICLDERVGITFVPCGHLVTCKTCSPKIRRCPLCRTFIRGTIKTTI